MNHKLRLAAAGLLLSLAACDDGPIDPGPVLTLTTEGILERGAGISISVTGPTGPVTGATLTAEPAGAVEWRGAGHARLLQAGDVTFRATSANASGSLTVTVAVPPLVAFESAESGARDIWRVALDGGDLLRLTQDPAEDASPTSAAGAVYFLSYRVSPAAVFSVPAAGGTATRITTVAGEYTDPAVSPDGQQLVFLRQVGGVSKVHVSERSGAGARRLTQSGGAVIEVSPAWSPDGQTIAFVSTAAGNADVYTVPVAGGTPQPVAATPAPEVEPAWSPDGTRVVFVRAAGSDVDLWAVTLATGQATRLTDAGNAVRPAWLADGRIVFTVTDGTQRLLHWLDPADPATLRRIPHDIAVSGRPVAVR